MQLRAVQFGLLTLLAAASVAQAGDYTAVEVGSTGLTLKNSAYPQDKHYLKQDSALLGRIATLMSDVDCLLEKLHALPPELADSPITQAPVSPELERLIELGLGNNPELKPYRSKLAMLAARTRFAGAKNDPMLSVMTMDTQFPMLPPDQKLMTSTKVELSQMFDTYGKRKLKRNVARLDERMLELELAAKEQGLARQITDLYFQMADTAAQLRVIESNVKLSDLFLELAEDKYALGDEMTPQAMVLDAQLMRSMLEEKRINLARLLDGQRVQLAGLLGRPAGFDAAALNLALAYPLPAAMTWDEKDLLAKTLKLSPDYRRMGLMQDQENLMLEMAHREYRPDLTATIGYQVDPGLRGMLEAGVMIPLFLNKEDRQDAKVQEAYASVQNAGDQRAAMENSMATMLGSMKIDLGRMGEMIELYRNGLVPQARLTLDSSIASYSANMLYLSDLITTQQKLLDLEQELERNYIGYLGMLADLQIASSGAFDPAPYLVATLDSTALDAVMPLVPSAIEQSVMVAEPPAETQAAPFVESLSLPAIEVSAGNGLTLPAGALAHPHGHKAAAQISYAARQVKVMIAPVTEPATGSPASELPAEAADAANSASAKPEDQFYQPYVPPHGDGENQG